MRGSRLESRVGGWDVSTLVNIITEFLKIIVVHDFGLAFHKKLRRALQLGCSAPAITSKGEYRLQDS